MGKNSVGNRRELSFDEDKPVDYVAQVVALINSGDYTAARNVITKIPNKAQRKGVYRTVAAKVGVYL